MSVRVEDAHLLKNFSQSELSELLSESVLLATGSFGTVFRVLWNGKKTALKVYKNDHTNKAICREVSLMAKCNHPNIIKIFGVGPSYPNKISFVVMEFADCFSLNDVLHAFPDVRYDLSHCLNWIARAADGANYLHNQCTPSFVHGDLKPANMLLFDSGRQLKLADFGTARSLDSQDTRPWGTLIYTAPEISCIREGMSLEFTEKSDVYSLTISFWEVLARQRPYLDSTKNCKLTIFWNIYHRRPAPLLQCPPLFSKLMERGWNADPTERPTMSQLSTILDTVRRLLFQSEDLSPLLDLPTELLTDKRDSEDSRFQFCSQRPTTKWCSTFDQTTVSHPLSEISGESPEIAQDVHEAMDNGKKCMNEDNQALSIICNWENT